MYEGTRSSRRADDFIRHVVSIAAHDVHRGTGIKNECAFPDGAGSRGRAVVIADVEVFAHRGRPIVSVVGGKACYRAGRAGTRACKCFGKATEAGNLSGDVEVFSAPRSGECSAACRQGYRRGPNVVAILAIDGAAVEDEAAVGVVCMGGVVSYPEAQSAAGVDGDATRAEGTDVRGVGPASRPGADGEDALVDNDGAGEIGVRRGMGESECPCAIFNQTTGAGDLAPEVTIHSTVHGECLWAED